MRHYQNVTKCAWNPVYKRYPTMDHVITQDQHITIMHLKIGVIHSVMAVQQ